MSVLLWGFGGPSHVDAHGMFFVDRGGGSGPNMHNLTDRLTWWRFYFDPRFGGGRNMWSKVMQVRAEDMG